jgi:hypothetical protein
MNSKIGKVIRDSDDNLLVIKGMNTSGGVDTELLKDYIMKGVWIAYEGQYKSIYEVVEDLCDEYLKNNEIIID